MNSIEHYFALDHNKNESVRMKEEFLMTRLKTWHLKDLENVFEEIEILQEKEREKKEAVYKLEKRRGTNILN